MTALQVTSTRHGSVPRLRVSGDIDLDTAGAVRTALEAHLEDAPDARVLADLSEVSFLDCSGLEALLAVSRQAQRRGGWLRLVAPSRHVVRLLELTGLAEQLPAYGDCDAAVRDVAPRYIELPAPRVSESVPGR
jgi:anti-anti-sigma factor